MGRLVEPFGSLKSFITLLVIFLISRLADLLLTYFGLEAKGWDFEKERTLIAQILMKWLGFFPSAVVGTILATILMLACVYLLFSFTTRMAGVTRARCGATVLMVWGSAIGILYGVEWVAHIGATPPEIKYFLYYSFFVFINKQVMPSVDMRLVISIVSAILIVGAVLLWPSKRPT